MAVAESITMIEGSETANLPFNDNAGPSASSLTNKAGNVPNRCGSAPPSLEEAFSAIRNSILDQQSTVKNVNKGMLDSTAEERVVTDPSYIAYYNAHINLNPRLPPPLISRESRHLVGRNTGFGHARKLIVADDIDTKMSSLSTRQEELQENALPQQVLEDRIVDRDNTATLAGSSKSFADLLQGLNDNRREVSTDDLPSTSFQHGNQDSSNSMIDGASTLLKTLNISGAETSVPEHMQRKHEDMLLCETYGLPFYPANGAIPQVQRFQPQYMPQGMNGSYSGVPTFPVPYAVPSSPYMSMGNPFVPRPTLTNFGSQFSLGGYTPPSPGFYMPQNMFTLPFDPRTRLNLFNKATTVHHHPFPSPLQGQYFQQSLMNNSGRDSAQFSQHAALLAQKQSNLHALMYHEHRNLPSGHLSSSGFNPVIQFPMNGRNHLVLGDQTGIPQRTFENADLYTEHRGSNNVEDPKRHPYLESLKFGGAAKLELSDIGGRIVEFSTDQLGSRFIQQKLEICTVQEKESVFTELLPHALRLMTDVFGNYVIQKLFEHGTSDQRKQLADQFKGQMVTLSLQMYGCRVIQKALEVIELDQKALLAQELDGHVVKCVHDQNGNHVIQKCIEHIPAEKIGFIFSALYGEVAMFSVHPYGCRVIQRALEHCSDTSATHFIIDEILDSASLLAHDQYGNYVIQHVLELGKPSERSRVISKLAGKFVEMSQHKYASNVIEKCLVHGDASEQESLIREIVGRTQEDATLLTMIKDQYANYVIQRIFDVCNDEERKILMDCVRENLESLKKYTYGKHIVARYERLESGNQEQRTG